ncbi:hypothetical protein FGO68_gene7419 [Halteria grandinella]|uniref:Uncharacterized protein n=1 Tax=Halteria grandinella TaxID=5974 RepID=A0A8J8NRC7_HALGN|nr:hypothetical protein FGO68_gene7419 [Halteria grandinella]
MPELIEFLRRADTLRLLPFISHASFRYLVQNWKKLIRDSQDVREIVLEAKRDPSRVKQGLLLLGSNQQKMNYAFNTGEGHVILIGYSHKIVVIDVVKNRFVQTLKVDILVRTATFHHPYLYTGSKTGLKIYRYTKTPTIVKNQRGKMKSHYLNIEKCFYCFNPYKLKVLTQKCLQEPLLVSMNSNTILKLFSIPTNSLLINVKIQHASQMLDIALFEGDLIQGVKWHKMFYSDYEQLFVGQVKLKIDGVTQRQDSNAPLFPQYKRILSVENIRVLGKDLLSIIVQDSNPMQAPKIILIDPNSLDKIVALYSLKVDHSDQLEKMAFSFVYQSERSLIVVKCQDVLGFVDLQLMAQSEDRVESAQEAWEVSNFHRAHQIPQKSIIMIVKQKQPDTIVKGTNFIINGMHAEAFSNGNNFSRVTINVAGITSSKVKTYHRNGLQYLFNYSL